MRLSCTRSPAGTIYRVYRADDNFAAQVRRLVPFILAGDYDVLVGGTNDEPDVVLTIGPLDEARDAMFQHAVAACLNP